MSDERSLPRYSFDGLSDKQAQVLAEALELLTRLGLGQIDYLMDFVRFGGVLDEEGKPLDFDRLERAEKLVKELKLVLTGHHPGRSKGVGSRALPPATHVAYEMQKAIRHRLAWDRNPDGGIAVDFGDPYLVKYSDQPRVTLKNQLSSADPLAVLPEGCFLGQSRAGWSVIRYDEQNRWTEVVRVEDALSAARQAAGKLAAGKAPKGT